MTDVLADPRADASGNTIRKLRHRYVVSPRGEYVHLPRTAQRFGRRLCVEALCGQVLHNPILTDDPAGALCGTCHGRDLGLTEADVRYRPRTIHWLPRRWCKGSGRHETSVDIPGSRHVRCLICNQVVRWWGDGPAKHHHNGTGVACPAHGSERIGATTGADGQPRLICWRFQCHLTPYRFWVITPHGRPPETPMAEPCTHGMPTHRACWFCMEDGNLDPATGTTPADEDQRPVDLAVVADITSGLRIPRNYEDNYTDDDEPPDLVA